MTADERVTPKTATVRAAWVRNHPFPSITSIEERRAEFDRMIKAERRAALEEYAQAVERNRHSKEWAWGDFPQDIRDWADSMEKDAT